MGWVSASPRSKNPKAKRQPRRVRLAKRGLSMDPADWGVDRQVSGYLLDAANELGWASSSGMGPSPLPWGEIHAYAAATGQNLAPWEARALRIMSEAYVNGYASESDLDPARWDRFTGALIPFIPITNDPVALVPELETG